MSVMYSPPGRRRVARAGPESNNWRAGPHTGTETSNIQPILRCADGTRIPLQQCGPSEFQVDEAYHVELIASTARGATVESPVVSSEESSSTLQHQSSDSAESSLTSVEVEEGEVTDDVVSYTAVVDHEEPSVEESATETPAEQTPTTVEEWVVPAPLAEEKVAVNKDVPERTMSSSRHAPQHAPSYMYNINYSDTEPDMSRKEYCAYWIRKGECDYTQQGCRFKHEMPDLTTLRRIGFREYPTWWRQAPRSMKLRLLNKWKNDANHAIDEDSVLSAALAQAKALEDQKESARLLNGGAVRARSPSVCSQVTDLLIDITPLEPEHVSSVPITNSTNDGSETSAQPAAAHNPSSSILSSSPTVQYLFRRPHQPSDAAETIPSYAHFGNLPEAEKGELLRQIAEREQNSKVSATPRPSINGTRSVPSSNTNLDASPITATSPIPEKASYPLSESKWANGATHPASVLAAAAGIKVDKVTLAPVGYPKSPTVAKHASPLSQRRHHKHGANKSAKMVSKTDEAEKKITRGARKGKVEKRSEKVNVVVVKNIAA